MRGGKTLLMRKANIVRSLEDLGFTVMDNKRFGYIRILFETRKGYVFSENVEYWQFEKPDLLSSLIMKFLSAIHNEF